MSVKRNILANYIGNAWNVLMGLAFIPLYIKYLGMEAYGLIGVFAALQAWLVLLEMGLGQTLSREMARFRGGTHTAQTIRNLLRSMEVIYVLMAVLIAVIILLAAPWLAGHWLRAEKLSLDAVAQALAITGGVVALRWLGGLYRSAIMGLQEQVWMNVSNMVFATLRGLGVVVVLIWVSPTIQAFFIYQGIIAGMETMVLGVMIHRFLPRSAKSGQFSWCALREVWRFASGIMVITLLSLMLTQMDKVLLARLLTLTDFGYYTLAGVMAGALYMMIGPISSATGPHMSELVAKGDEVAIRCAYHRYAQLLTLAIVPAALVVSFFADHLLLLWTRNPETTHAVAPIVSVLIIGTMLNGLMHTPYLLQLAYGWTRLTTVVNSVAVAILVPALYVVTQRFGPVGAAWVWVLLNTGYIVFALPFMHRRLLKGELGGWYLRDVIPPVLAVIGVVSISRAIAPEPLLSQPFTSLIVLVVVAVTTIFVAGLVTPLGREIMMIFRNHYLGI